jgi:tight adherence protein C
VALGVPRAEALDRLAARAPVAGVHALVAALARAERHGAPLAPALAALGEEARGDRARATRDRAARAAPKIQLVVALLLVPAVLLMVAAALAAALL